MLIGCPQARHRRRSSFGISSRPALRHDSATRLFVQEMQFGHPILTRLAIGFS
jgi:hypothetical protein